MAATIGYGASLTVTDGTAGAAQAIPEVTMISLPPVEASVVEASYLGMSSTRRQYIPGLQEPASMSFECLYEGTTAVRLEALRGVTKTWVISDPAAGHTWTFSGFLTKYEGSFETDVVSKLKAEVKVSGAVTLA